MNLHEIEKLLEKYFEGDTSLSEEKKLRDFFAAGNVPERWKGLEKYFIFMIREQDQQLQDNSFDEKVLSAMKRNKLAPVLDLHRPWIYWIAGVAAGLLILLAILVKFDPFSGKIEDTYRDPQTAYIEARKILLYVSAQFNKGTSALKPVATLQTGLDDLKPVAAYDKGLNEVSRLDEVEKVEKFITNN
jgi:hypothetical protein